MRGLNGSIVHDDVASIEPVAGNHIAFTDAAGLRHVVPAASILRLHSMLEHHCKTSGIDFEVWARGQIEAQALRITKPSRVTRRTSSHLLRDELPTFLDYVSREKCVPVRRDFLIAIHGMTPRETVPANAIYWRGDWHNITYNKTAKRWGVPEGIREIVEEWRKK